MENKDRHAKMFWIDSISVIELKLIILLKKQIQNVLQVDETAQGMQCTP